MEGIYEQKWKMIFPKIQHFLSQEERKETNQFDIIVIVITSDHGRIP